MNILKIQKKIRQGDYQVISILKNIPASVSSAVKRQGDEGSDFNPGMPDSYSGLI